MPLKEWMGSHCWHVTGHGVLPPTPEGEVWAFNEEYSAYLPVPLIDLHAWLGSPAIVLFDTNHAGPSMCVCMCVCVCVARKTVTRPTPTQLPHTCVHAPLTQPSQ